ncbi:MAG: hypothetical protein PHP03_01590 [Candidatus Pacebacteria bacterium]|nr:hypothetical protein [Candidatus Paceibacterota bacterium]
MEKILWISIRKITEEEEEVIKKLHGKNVAIHHKNDHDWKKSELEEHGTIFYTHENDACLEPIAHGIPVRAFFHDQKLGTSVLLIGSYEAPVRIWPK